MTILQDRRPDTGSRSVRPAWIAVALVPVGLALGVAVGFLGGERPGGVAGALVASLLSLAAPTAAVILAVQAARARQRSTRIAVVVAGLLLVGTFVWLPLTVISIGAGWIIALVAVVAVLGVFGWRFRTKPLPPA